MNLRKKLLCQRMLSLVMVLIMLIFNMATPALTRAAETAGANTMEDLQLEIIFNSQAVSIGEETMASLKVKSAKNLYGFDISMNYDPQFFDLEGLTPNTEFDIGDKGLNLDSTDGNIHIIGVLEGQTAGLDGDINLVDFKFKAKNKIGSTNLTLLPGSQFSDGDLALYTFNQSLAQSMEVVQNEVNKPVLQSAETNKVGSQVILTFDKSMADPSGKQNQFSVAVSREGTDLSETISGVSREADNHAKIDLKLTKTLLKGDVITLNYSQGDVAAEDGSLLSSFNNQAVKNDAPEAVSAGSTNITGNGEHNFALPEDSSQQIDFDVPIDASVSLNIIKEFKPSEDDSSIIQSNELPPINFSSTVDLNNGNGGSSSVVVNVQIPAGTKVSAPVSSNWDGTIHSPTVQSVTSVTVPTEEGHSTPVVSSVIEVGFEGVPLTFTDAVRLLIPGGAGQEAGFFRDGSFYKITKVISADNQSTADSELGAGAEGRINVGSDLLIWTKHFTKFVTYTAPASGGHNGGSSHSGGNSSSSNPQTGSALLASSDVQAGSEATIQANDGTAVVIPEGALADTGSTVNITISSAPQCAEPNTPGITSFDPQDTARSFGPSGSVFKVPVEITLPFGQANIDPGDYAYLAIFTWRNDHWQKVGGVVNPTSKTISATVGHFSDYRIMADRTTDIERIGGFDRYETAIKIAQTYFASGTDTVVLTRGDNSADALTSVPLAKKLNAPLLLTPHDKLPVQVLDEIKTLGAKTVYIVGGEMAVSQQIADSVKEQGISVQRVAGQDRYGTAYAVAKLLGYTGQAVIVNGNDATYPDALSVSSWAAYHGVPILYADGSNTLPVVTASALAELNVNRTILVGGTAVLPQSLEGLVPHAERYAGQDRYGTNVQVLSKLQPNPVQIFAASGRDYADALAGAVVAGQSNAWVVLTDYTDKAGNGLKSEQTDIIRNTQDSILTYHVLGGKVAVPDNTLSLIKSLLSK
ncbi:cell wall-binding repeat-containing protein [Desulfosporosinus sp. OT]|uniref:cell wall-binding repeat-containing protein n=1 Tax=Desulfosporosinus sp. OT TaxID=913865 RepID=UPI000223A1A4|nr:cell wall-binding repeat-containing protein [Desulfosporosinus sp. OT]EGW37951.1 cell wall binding repeat 2 family protein [Desulfosporosinus sp. OT]